MLKENKNTVLITNLGVRAMVHLSIIVWIIPLCLFVLIILKYHPNLSIICFTFIIFSFALSQYQLYHPCLFANKDDKVHQREAYKLNRQTDIDNTFDISVHLRNLH